MRRAAFGAKGKRALCLQLPSCHNTSRGHKRQARASEEGSAKGGGSRDDSPAISEDILAKLRQYEEENKKLKDRLEDKEAPAASSSDSERSAPRIDGTGLTRESFFGKQERKSWLSEGDIDFFTGGKPGEIVNDSMKMSSEEQGIVRRRILIALGLTAATVAFANVPTEILDGSANKPVAAYLVPVLRSIDLLEDVEKDIKETGEMDSLPRAINNILKKPNEARKNMYTAIEYLERNQQQAARELVGGFVDLVQQADSQSYFDTKGPKDGKLMAKYQDFSLQSLRAAAREARAFVKLFPYYSVNEARAMLQDVYSA